MLLAYLAELWLVQCNACWAIISPFRWHALSICILRYLCYQEAKVHGIGSSCVRGKSLHPSILHWRQKFEAPLSPLNATLDRRVINFFPPFSKHGVGKFWRQEKPLQIAINANQENNLPILSLLFKKLDRFVKKDIVTEALNCYCSSRVTRCLETSSAQYWAKSA